MHRILLMLIPGFLCCVISSVHASDDTVPAVSSASETQKSCTADSEEACKTEEGEAELDRGFDPCLINASLPACKSDTKGADSGAAEKAPSDAEDPDGSG